MKCRYCGNNILGDVKFCTLCGNPVDGEGIHWAEVNIREVGQSQVMQSFTEHVQATSFWTRLASSRLPPSFQRCHVSQTTRCNFMAFV